MERSGGTSSGRTPGLRKVLWVALAALPLVLVWLASYRPSWPWFSLWLVTLLGGLAVLSHPRVRATLNLSWFGLTLLVLTGTCMFDLYLFRVETHRQRSERLEVHGVYFGPDHGAIRVGVGEPDLDVRLEGSLFDFDRWSLELRPTDGNRFRVEQPHQIDMLRTRGAGGFLSRSGGLGASLGTALNASHPSLADSSAAESGARGSTDGPDIDLHLEREGTRGTLVLGDARAALSLDDALLDRRLSRGLSSGMLLSELEWDRAPDSDLADDLVLTRTARGRTLGRLRLSLPGYRVVSRSGRTEGVNGDPLILSAGDTLWVASRGKRWAFAVGRVPGVSRVAAPMAVNFVRGPRRTGWALPSPEACGRSADRCAVISSKPLPPPQPHFDLSGFGLDTTRYSVLARLETEGEGVRAVGARSEVAFGYGEVVALPALAAGRRESTTGLLIEVSRASQGRLGAVLLTVFTLYTMLIGALLIVSGDTRLWQSRRIDSPHLTAAWGFLNVFLIFLGIRLALGLRVAYSAPFNDRAATTAVGLWIAFSVLLVALARWSAWTPRFWALVRRVEKPVSRLFLPGMNGADSGPAPALPQDPVTPDVKAAEVDAQERRRARRRTLYGAVLFLPSLGWVIWQRPETAAALLVAAAALSAWLAMGLGPMGRSRPLGRSPLDVITAEGGAENPSLSFAVSAGASVVLVLAMHAPELALAPVLLLLALFGIDRALGFSDRTSAPSVRIGVMVAVLASLIGIMVFAFSPWPGPSIGVLGALVAGAAVMLNRRVPDSDRRYLASVHDAFLDLERIVFSGVGWVGVLSVLGVLTFLNFQEIPPFVRFALVFMLFLLAIRAGLACRRVLDTGVDRGRFEALGLLVIPLGVLLVFMLFDFGLGLVFFAPMFVTVLLAARIDRLPGVLVLGSAGVVALVGIVAWSVLSPSLDGLRAAPDVASFSEEYSEVGNVLTDGLRKAGLSGPITRATVRSIAASDPQLLEEALAFAGPSEALFAAAPSREQVWGGKAYASAGWTGTGFAGTTLLGRGVPTAVSYAENTFSVYVLSEHGALGGIAVLLAYLALLVVVGFWVGRVHSTIQDSPLGLAVLAMTVGGVLWLTIPAVYVAASNLALVPLTGQNMPFLGLNSWADVVLVSGLASGIVLALAGLAGESQERPEVA